ncbi:MAG: sodium:calcium antiporter, partial [Kiritimatiellae bacterium]|nr:sodium:calcium antiporter [Kiritimatiellia bacterium]
AEPPAPAPDAPPPMRAGAAAWRLAVGLAVLVLSSKALVWGASGVARALGVSDLLVGLTVVAVGTSLPELASSVAATMRGEDDIAVGNVIGSNLFNTLAVVGLAGAIAPLRDVPDAVLVRDLSATFAFTAALWAFSLARRRGRPGVVPRWGGALLLAGYLAYVALLLRAETGAA